MKSTLHYDIHYITHILQVSIAWTPDGKSLAVKLLKAWSLCDDNGMNMNICYVLQNLVKSKFFSLCTANPVIDTAFIFVC